MASRSACNPNVWQTFWGHIDGQGNRFRHKIRQGRKDKADAGVWYIQTEVWMDGDPAPYHTARIVVPAEVGEACFPYTKVYSNVDEHLNTKYPPEYVSGFPKVTPNAE